MAAICKAMALFPSVVQMLGTDKDRRIASETSTHMQIWQTRSKLPWVVFTTTNRETNNMQREPTRRLIPMSTGTTPIQLVTLMVQLHVPGRLHAGTVFLWLEARPLVAEVLALLDLDSPKREMTSTPCAGMDPFIKRNEKASTLNLSAALMDVSVQAMNRKRLLWALGASVDIRMKICSQSVSAIA